MRSSISQHSIIIADINAALSSSAAAPPVPLPIDQTVFQQLKTLAQQQAQKEDANTGSITPTTAGDVTHSFLYTPASLEAFRVKLHQVAASIHQTYQSNVPLQDGNTIIETNRVLQELDHVTSNAFIFKRDYQADISTASPYGPLVTRFGIYPEALGGLGGDENYAIPKNQLHIVEQEIFKLALAELAGRPSAEELEQSRAGQISTALPAAAAAATAAIPSTTQAQFTGFAQNVVVVDILVRENGKIKVENGVPHTHAIVLWKEKDDKIILIDPNKGEFSAHIGKALHSIPAFSLQPQVVSGLMPDEVPYANLKKITGYSPDDDENPKPRDCVDIAVKLALEIEQQQQLRTPVGAIQIKALKQISNKSDYAEHLGNINDTFIRVFQSSDYRLRVEGSQFVQMYPEAVKNAQVKNLSPSSKWKVEKSQHGIIAKIVKEATEVATKAQEKIAVIDAVSNTLATMSSSSAASAVSIVPVTSTSSLSVKDVQDIVSEASKAAALAMASLKSAELALSRAIANFPIDAVKQGVAIAEVAADSAIAKMREAETKAIKNMRDPVEAVLTIRKTVATALTETEKATAAATAAAAAASLTATIATDAATALEGTVPGVVAAILSVLTPSQTVTPPSRGSKRP